MTANGRYLVDTHAIMWAVENPSRLSRAAAAAIRKGPVTLSVASFWEVVIKSGKSYFIISDPVRWWAQVVGALDASIALIRPEHVTAVAQLADHHSDPFDRILIGQAIAEDLTLITNDADIRRYPVRTLW